MNHLEFDEVVKSYLVHFGTKNNSELGGEHRGKRYMHILDIPKGKTKENIVKESNLLPEIKELPWIPFKLQSCAHHLNSSQIMCYNFFRRFIDNNGKPSKQLVEILHDYCHLLEYHNNAKCKFEYIENDVAEKTNFDFYIESGGIKVYCEIKYTEPSFSKSGGGQNPSKQFMEIYKPFIDSNKDLWKREITEKDVMKDYYQLFRNAMRANTEGKYVLFICPKDREDLEKDFMEFKDKFLKKEGLIRYVYWEDLISKAKSQNVNMDSFENKYFGYKEWYSSTSPTHTAGIER